MLSDRKNAAHCFVASLLGQETDPQAALEEIEMLEKIIEDKKQQLRKDSFEE